MAEWYEKEEAYCDRVRSRRISKDIWKYIPRRVMEGVTDAFVDDDGYWICLDYNEGGWVAYDGGEDCGIIHEYSIADLRDAIKTIRKVTI